MRKLILCCALLLFGTPALFTPAWGAPRQNKTAALTNENILSMVQSGISAEVIVARIESSRNDFDTSPAELEKLKKAGVPESVMIAIIRSASDEHSGSQAGRCYPQGQAKEQPVLLVSDFTVVKGISWPYDMQGLEIQTASELGRKQSKFEVCTKAPTNADQQVYALHLEVLSWHPGNRATRVLVGWGTGRESAEICYSITDPGGTKVFEHGDTIRQSFYGGSYADSVGELAQPLADKITERLREAKFFQGS